MDDAERMALIEEAVVPVVDAHGLELVDLEWRGLRSRGVLRVYVDKAGGVGIGECERLSRVRYDQINRALLWKMDIFRELNLPVLDDPFKDSHMLR